jgi:hypothetical protein
MIWQCRTRFQASGAYIFRPNSSTEYPLWTTAPNSFVSAPELALVPPVNAGSTLATASLSTEACRPPP